MQSLCTQQIIAVKFIREGVHIHCAAQSVTCAAETKAAAARHHNNKCHAGGEAADVPRPGATRISTAAAVLPVVSLRPSASA